MWLWWVRLVEWECQDQMVILQVLSIRFGSQRMVVVMLVLPKGIESQRMMMSQIEDYTYNWCCDCTDVVVVSLGWYW